MKLISKADNKAAIVAAARALYEAPIANGAPRPPFAPTPWDRCSEARQALWIARAKLAIRSYQKAVAEVLELQDK